MLTGKFNQTIDAKNRLIIPAKLKEQLGPVITIIKDSSKCLCAYSEKEWGEYTEQLNSLPKTETKVIARFLYSNAMELSPDSQGRVVLPQGMLEYAGITKNVVTVGCGKYVEIWAEDRWNELNMDEEPENFEELLKKYGL